MNVTVDLEDFRLAVAKRFPGAVHRGRTAAVGTPSELIDDLSAQATPTTERRSLTQHAFYRIRRLLGAELQCDPKAIRPRTRLDQLMLDPAGRQYHWKAIRSALGVAGAPRLARPEGVAWAMAIAVGFLFLSAAIASADLFGASSGGFLAALLVTGGGCWMALRVTRRWATRFEPASLTVGDLAYFVVAYGSSLIEPALQPRHRSQIMEVVRALIRLEIGVPGSDLDATWEDLR